jgi:serine/threonine protein kinase
MSPPRKPADPPELEGYAYLQLLGSGGFADVFLYERALPRMQVAVKVLVGTDLTFEARRRFTDEANTMARFSSHPFIVPIFGADISSDGRPYIVMQYYPNDNLAVRARRQPLSTTDALRIAIQISSAVETAHRAGILHRDIKPANILTSEFGDPGLTDFGIAGTSTGDTIEYGEGLSIPWSPPEAFESPANLDERSDVYSLGASLFHLLTGRSPFEHSDGNNSVLMLMERIERTPVPATGRSDVPAQLERVLGQAMAKSPESRHSSALLFARDLQAVELELHVKMTTIVVPTDLTDAPQQEISYGADQTRGRIGPKIDPHADPQSTAHRVKGSNQILRVPTWDPHPAPALTPIREQISGPPSDPHSLSSSPTDVAEELETRSRPRKVDVPEVIEEPRRSSSRIGLFIGLGVIALAGIAVTVALLIGGSSKPPKPSLVSTDTTAPIILLAPTQTDVVAKRSATSPTTVTVKWVNPDPMPRDYYEVTETLSGQDVDSKPSHSEEVQFPDVPTGGSRCFTVVLQRFNGGQPSTSSTPGCVNG